VTELARSQKVSLKVNITGSCFTESFFIWLKDWLSESCFTESQDITESHYWKIMSQRI
jgi:hypothetical protein